MTLLELLTELEQKSKAPRREFWIACPQFGDFDYCETIVSKDPECTKIEYDFKFNAIHVQEILPSVPTDKLIEVCKVLVEGLKEIRDLYNSDLTDYKLVIKQMKIASTTLTTAEKILKGEM